MTPQLDRQEKRGPDWTSFTSIFKWTVKTVGIPGTIILVIVLAPYIKDFLRPATSQPGYDLGKIEVVMSAHEAADEQRIVDLTQRIDAEIKVLQDILVVTKDRNDYARSQTILLRMLCRDQVAKELKPQCER